MTTEYVNQIETQLAIVEGAIKNPNSLQASLAGSRLFIQCYARELLEEVKRLQQLNLE